MCFIDLSTDELRGLSLLRELSSKELTLILLHSVTDSGLILRALRCGAHEFLCQPFEAEPSWAVLDELAARPRGQSAKREHLGGAGLQRHGRNSIPRRSVTPQVPISILQTHLSVSIFLDVDAASQLSVRPSMEK